MSFEILLETCHHGTEYQDGVNPFTREPIRIPIGDSVPPEQRKAIRQCLKSAGARTPHGPEIFIVDSPAAGAVFQFEGLDKDPEFTGGMVELRGLDDEAAALLHTVALRGHLAIRPIMERSSVIVPDGALLHGVQARWPDAVVASTPKELVEVLRRGFEEWERHRANVTEDE
jgi:hypothetical protein